MMKRLSSSPDLAELIRAAVQHNQSNIHVSLPGKIESYDATQQKADIKPLLKRPLVASDGTELESESLPVLMDVPICFPRGGSGVGRFCITWPLSPGDLVHLVFVERSIDQYLDKSGEETDPLDYRMHSLSDAVAYPCFYPRKLSLKSAHTENMVIGDDEGSQIHIKTSGEIDIGSENAADFVALAQLVKDEITALRNTVDALVTSYNAHVHGGVMSGAAFTSVIAVGAVAPAAIGDVAATKVKAD